MPEQNVRPGSGRRPGDGRPIRIDQIDIERRGYNIPKSTGSTGNYLTIIDLENSLVTYYDEIVTRDGGIVYRL
ncbi:hypothetical protein LCGC14_1744360 [marine sediment metagenome]|uniref:Uncharacterized protein n=1 Tax=marine sediment metagenome TaxID=412755 RepID=A0A0F9HTE1_9ZZZZ